MRGRAVGLGSPVPSCPVHVSWAGDVSLSAQSPCGRLFVLRVRWAALTPSQPSAARRLRGWASRSRSVRRVVCLVSAPADVCVGVAPSVAPDPEALRWLRACLPCAAGASRASPVPAAALHASHARRGPRQIRGDLTTASPLGRLLGRSPPRRLHDARSRGGLQRWDVRSSLRSTGCPGSASAVSFGRPLPPPPLPHAGGVAGSTFLRRDVHPARSAKLRLAH